MNPLIIKLGGVLLDSEEALERLFTALVNYRESHQRPLVIVPSREDSPKPNDKRQPEIGDLRRESGR